MTISTNTPITPGKEDAPHSIDPRVIYLAPRCCYRYRVTTQREWFEHNVWPCQECPNPKTARVAKYILAAQIMPMSDDPEERGEE